MDEFTRRLMLAQQSGALVLGADQTFARAAQVAHDDWCLHLNSRGECRCNPQITVLDIKGRLLQVYDGGEVKVLDTYTPEPGDGA